MNRHYAATGIIKKLRELDLPENDYACTGSLGLYLHGMVDTVHDIDIVARGKAWEKALTLGELSYDKYYHHKDRIALFNGQIEIFQKWPSENTDWLIDHAEIIDGIRVVKLGKIFKYMKLLNRPKDRQHLQNAIRYLQSFLEK